MDDVEGIPLLDVAHVELSRFNTIVKRVFDLVVGGVLTLLALPLIGLLALAIKLDSRGPVFFRQERMGRGGKMFRIFKLRSMHVDAEQRRYDLAEQNEYSGPMFKIKSDPRITRVGRAASASGASTSCRSSSTCMRGDMSLVGPAPALGRRGRALPRLDQEAPRHHARHHRPVAGDWAATTSRSTRWSSSTTCTSRAGA